MPPSTSPFQTQSVFAPERRRARTAKLQCRVVDVPVTCWRRIHSVKTLINPCKPELGKVSKQTVGKIVHNIRSKTNTNQWKNTNAVINWFNAIKDKSNYTMICFDICDFYPSSTNTLLQKALNYASKYADTWEDQIHLITHTEKTTLFKDGNPWEKNNVSIRSDHGELRRCRNM